MTRRIHGLMAAALLSAAATSASAGLVFDITYSAAVQANANFAAIKNDVTFVANEFSSLYSDNVTLNFQINQAPGILGESLFSNAYYRGSYASIRSALAADSSTASDAIAVANLPGAAPIGSGANAWYVTSAQAKALGLLGANNAASDGTYTFGSDLGLFDFDRSNGIAAGAYDFIGTTEHEFSELMGRVSQLTNTGFGYTAFDAFRYTSPGVSSFNPSSCGVYYSIDGGVTNQKRFNCVPNADVQDWDGSVPSDPFNAFGSSGVVNSLSAIDEQVMDVIGWNLAAAHEVPEPSSIALAIVAGGLLWQQRRRKLT
jgi:hypothetical protein